MDGNEKIAEGNKPEFWKSAKTGKAKSEHSTWTKTIEGKSDFDTSTKTAENESDFWKSVKTVENDETKLLKLQQEYRQGKIKESQLTNAQVEALCKLYDEQIKTLKETNTKRKEKLLAYRKKNMK